MKINTHYLIMAYLFFLAKEAIAQEEGLGIGTTAPNKEAVVDIESSNKGFLMPRYETALSDRSHSVPDIDGMLFYDKAGNNIMLYDSFGSGWTPQGFLPIGAITMWNGTKAEIPPGWRLCDGEGGTPNLSGKFIVAYDPADPDYNPIGKGGGSHFVPLDATHLPSHTHGVSDPGHVHSASASHGHKFTVEEYRSILSVNGSINNGGSPTSPQTFTTAESSFTGAINISPATIGSTVVGSTGGNQGHDNRPPFYILAFIIRVN